MARTTCTIFLVDDAPSEQRAYQQSLDNDPKVSYNAIQATSTAQALELWPRHRFDLALLVHRLPEFDSPILLTQLRAMGQPDVPAIVLLDSLDRAIAAQAKAAGAVACLVQGQMTLEALHRCLDILSTGEARAITPEAPKLQTPKFPNPALEQFTSQFTPDQIQAALSSGKIYLWRWHTASDRIVTNCPLMQSPPPAADLDQPLLEIPLARFLGAVHPSDRRQVAEGLQAAAAAGQDYAGEYRLLTAAGQDRWVDARGQVTTGPAGAVTGLSGVLIDITERKQAEQALSLQAQDLAQLNRCLEAVTQKLNHRNADLDQFASAVSHDLKAPLRGISNLARWLQEDLEPSVPPESRRQIALLLERVSWMEALIDGLLSHARTGQCEQAQESVDVAQLVQDVIATLAPPAKIDIQLTGDFPVLKTRRLVLRQVLTNLLSNAIDHGCPEAQGKIILSVCSVQDHYEFCIRDRGPGVAPADQGRIFDLFETLRAKPPADSTGVGLAIVKRLVEAEGGKVWIASDMDQGMAVSFTWFAEA